MQPGAENNLSKMILHPQSHVSIEIHVHQSPNTDNLPTVQVQVKETNTDTLPPQGFSGYTLPSNAIPTRPRRYNYFSFRGTQHFSPVHLQKLNEREYMSPMEYKEKVVYTEGMHSFSGLPAKTASHSFPGLPANPTSHSFLGLPAKTASHSFPGLPANMASHSFSGLPANMASHSFPGLPANMASHSSPTMSAPPLYKEETIVSKISLPGLGKHWMSIQLQHIYLSLIFFAIGFSAITALAIAIIGILPLDIAAYVLIWPSMIVWIVLGVLYPKYGKLALKGFVIGIIACFLYDCMRFTTIALGLWGDFIPKIGMWLLHTNKPDWVIGYTWRYIGDGGFMGMAFVVCYCLLNLQFNVRISALVFGIFIWLCLIATILFAPDGSQMLFKLTPVTFGLSLLGHIIYGLSIGFLYPLFIPKKDFAHANPIPASK